MKSYNTKAFYLFIFSLIFVFFLSIFKISILDERIINAQNAKSVSADWGTQNELIIPFLKAELYDIKEKKQSRIYFQSKFAELGLDFNVLDREKGIFKLPIYKALVDLNASFDFNELAEILETNENLYVKSLSFVLYTRYGFTDFVKKFESKTLNLKEEIFDHKLLFNIAQENIKKPFITDIQASFELKGSELFEIYMLAKDWEINLSSNSKNLSFGGVLPQNYEQDQGKFKAFYKGKFPKNTTINCLDDDYLHSDFISCLKDFEISPVQMEIYGGVSEYRLIERMLKYGYFFVGLSLLALFLCEFVGKKSVALIQYAVVCVSLAVFYLCLLAFSEHIGFNLAYFISSLSVIIPVSFYTFSIMGNKIFAGIIFSVLTLLYVCLFIMLKQDQYAFLTGTVIAMFAVYITMFLTRNLNKNENEITP
ncbi:hypothetical protein DMB92_08035 [Campylobacter sp. MIT 99-7217]|uniref:inner membrane CreD family protein n=1 Tax=Campylobacter sp. MIT 99-7217 TaxID=535091 RepID=UPI00115B6D0E|nr:inner membrane CreD family protein [Campylobacter sp. MIT 99-7217]TQR29544.1 hypothetical protein DMB92_08035 [Campylobacter sp. MIT 99-7217]